uniref:Uncharacterized protein n=1 Tax=Ditylum brightwellii TaxID=49249 RepID=A0A7S4V0T7_9STRA|mmetsp:Transcript_35116/g.47173  ORF Transcript_35116/g.47173 Transcript_35116/m.47173 type:complete len:539 (+) Transcript_35116:64-1680(+)
MIVSRKTAKSRTPTKAYTTFSSSCNKHNKSTSDITQSSALSTMHLNFIPIVAVASFTVASFILIFATHAEFPLAQLSSASSVRNCRIPFRPTSAWAEEDTTAQVQHVRTALSESITELGYNPPDPVAVESWAVLIHSSMEAPYRKYHALNHAFELSEGADADPIEILSALFHDVVQYSVDGDLTDSQRNILGTSIIPTDENGYALSKEIADSDLAMVLSVFGRTAGEVVVGPSVQRGGNELLSAMIAVRSLQNVLSTKHLLAITACHEMTIPFRKIDTHGQSDTDRLRERLTQTNEAFGIGMDIIELDEVVHKAVRLANRDVAAFQSPDPALFVSNSLQLILETSPNLLSPKSFTIDNYVSALKGSEHFLSGLDPRDIFPSFKGTPNSSQIYEMRTRCTRNLDIAVRYLRAILTELYVVSAISVLTGEDVPMMLFWEDDSFLLEETQIKHCSHDFCIPGDGEEAWCSLSHPSSNVDEEVYCLLESFKSRLAAFLYKILGDNGIENLLLSSKATTFPMTKDSAKSLLETIPKCAVEYIL